MAEKDTDFKENVKKSFSKVKEDIDRITSINNENNAEILKIKEEIARISKKRDELSTFLEKKGENNVISLKSSIGNKGVINDQQRSTMINNDQRSTTILNNQQQSTTNPAQATLIDPAFVKNLRELTDREFSIFIKVYELNTIKDEIRFSDLANILKITEGTIRGSVSRIITKGLPLVKERFFNKKSSLFIDPSFFNPSLLPEIMKLKNAPTQKTLNDKAFAKSHFP